jgi:hypothetical protein
MGRARVTGRCPCGHRYRRREPFPYDEPTPVQNAIARLHAVRLVGTDSPLPGVVLHQAITENA